LLFTTSHLWGRTSAREKFHDGDRKKAEQHGKKKLVIGENPGGRIGGLLKIR